MHNFNLKVAMIARSQLFSYMCIEIGYLKCMATTPYMDLLTSQFSYGTVHKLSISDSLTVQLNSNLTPTYMSVAETLFVSK